MIKNSLNDLTRTKVGDTLYDVLGNDYLVTKMDSWHLFTVRCHDDQLLLVGFFGEPEIDEPPVLFVSPVDVIKKLQ
jgi:hypothetical protein